MLPQGFQVYSKCREYEGRVENLFLDAVVTYVTYFI